MVLLFWTFKNSLLVHCDLWIYFCPDSEQLRTISPSFRCPPYIHINAIWWLGEIGIFASRSLFFWGYFTVSWTRFIGVEWITLQTITLWQCGCSETVMVELLWVSMAPWPNSKEFSFRQLWPVSSMVYILYSK